MEPELCLSLLWRPGSAVACCRGRGSGCSWLGCGISLLGGGCHQPHHRAARTYTELGNRLLEGTDRILCTPIPRRKEQWPQKRLTQTCPWVPRILQWRRGSAGACCRAGGTDCNSACMGPFEGGRHYLLCLHNRLAPGKYHPLVKWCSKFSKPGFSNTWTMKFQMFKLVLEKAEEPEIKLTTSAGSLKKQESSRKTSISALLTMPKPLTVWMTKNCGNFWKRWEHQTPWLVSWEICMQVRK